MAYIDQKTGGNQRAAIAGVVALIQGAAIVALIHGLAVQYFDAPPPPRLAGEQIKLTPPPDVDIKPSPEPSQLPSRDDRPVEAAKPPIDLDAGGTVIVDITPGDVGPPRPQDPVEVAVKPPFVPLAAKPRNAPGSWATANDYPPRDLREGNQGVTHFTVTIGLDGRVQSCTVTVSSGFPRLDKATCDNVSRRARFEPATDGNGSPVSGTYSNRIRWEIPQG